MVKKNIKCEICELSSYYINPGYKEEICDLKCNEKSLCNKTCYMIVYNSCIFMFFRI